jgi:hypothetical protein
MTRSEMSVDQKKVTDEEKFDGKWVLRTNTQLVSRRNRPKIQRTGKWSRFSEMLNRHRQPDGVFIKKMKQYGGHVFCKLSCPVAT